MVPELLSSASSESAIRVISYALAHGLNTFDTEWLMKIKAEETAVDA
jgi:predicted aldo/keto reductase-like oxidoreductase